MYTHTFMFNSFRFSGKFLILISPFAFFQFYPQKSTIRQVFILSTIILSGHQAEIRWSVFLSQKCLILQDGFWVLHIPFVHMVKFKLLAQFPVDHLVYPVVSSLIRFLRLVTAFAYYVIDRFLSITTWPTLAILLRLVYSCFYFISLRVFLHQCKLMVFHWSLNGTKSPQISRTLLSILADLKNAVVWMFFTRPIIIIIIIIIITIIYSLEFFTSMLADGFSLEFEWQQVSSSLRDSSQDSSRSQHCCHLDSLYPSANFQVFQAL